MNRDKSKTTPEPLKKQGRTLQGGSPAYEPKPVTPRALTSKQKAFIKYLVDNPKASATEAVRASYNVTTDNSASQIATENLRKPQIVTILEQYGNLFESTVVQTVKDWGNSDNTRQRELALQASYWGHDKVHGKATQRVEQRTTGVTLSIDLTGLGVDKDATGASDKTV